MTDAQLKAQKTLLLTALWDLQRQPDCWCAEDGFAPSVPAGEHAPACAFARLVTKVLGAEEANTPALSTDDRIRLLEQAVRE